MIEEKDGLIRVRVTDTIYHSPGHPSELILPVLNAD